MSEHMDYNKWLENEVKRLEKENEQLKQSKKEVYKWAYSLEKENEQLKERLKKESFYYEWQNTLEENEQLKKEIVHLKECNLRYRNHNELLESIIGIRNNVIE